MAVLIEEDGNTTALVLQRLKSKQTTGNGRCVVYLKFKHSPIHWRWPSKGGEWVGQAGFGSPQQQTPPNPLKQFANAAMESYWASESCGESFAFTCFHVE